MRYLILTYLLLFSTLFLQGCQSLFPENPFNRPVLNPFSALDAEEEAAVQALYEQKYIDPLTDYINKNKRDEAKQVYVEQVQVERERRCMDIQARYDERPKTMHNLQRLRSGYNYSCPAIVTAFAKQVPASPAKRPPTSNKTSTPPQPAPKPADQPANSDTEKVEAPAQETPKQTEAQAVQAAAAATAAEAIPEQATLEQQAAACTTAFYAENDYPKAFDLCELPAQQNNSKAQYAMGFLYEKGRAVEKDDTMALNWYQKAASNGLPKAQFVIGRRYYTGEGVTRDYIQAAAWQRQAANQNHVEAQYILAVMYELGQGVPQDFVLAYQWSLLAAAQGHRGAVTLRDELGAKLSPSQKSEGQRMAREWFEKRNNKTPIPIPTTSSAQGSACETKGDAPQHTPIATFPCRT